MEPKVHLGGFVLNAGIWMGGSIIEKLVDTEGEIGPGACGNGGGDGADCGLHGIVDGTSIVIEDASEFLAVFELRGGELTFVSCGYGELLLLSIRRGGVGVWRVLWFLWGWMAEACKGFVDVIGHREIDGAIGVIPQQMDAAEELTVGINCEVVVFLEAVDEMIGVGLADDFDSKVVDDKVEGDGTCLLYTSDAADE